MKRMVPLAVLAFAAAALAATEIPVQKVADDAMVVDRVAQAAKRDLPQDLLERILNEDIELLRGKRADNTYEYATYEKLEASRSDQSYSVQPSKSADAPNHYDIKGSFVYRMFIDLPSRRMLVTKNRRVYVDRVELEYIPMNTPATQRTNIKVEAWMEPGETRPVDFPEVARQATARVFAKADDKAGYGNIVLTLIKARIIDNADSPYADPVASAKAIIRSVDNGDIPSIRAMAARMRERLLAAAPAPAVQTVEVIAPPKATPQNGADLYAELQSVEDLLTGTEVEKREGVDRLHQILRRLRPR